MHKYALLLADVSLIAVSPIVAQYMRDNLELNGERFELIAPYLALNALVAGVVFLAVGAHRGLWRYASLTDLFRVARAATAAILITLFLAFAMNRLEGVGRSIPVIQWFVVLAVLCATRISARVARERARRGRNAAVNGNVSWSRRQQNIIVIGLNAITELYLGFVAEYTSERLTVVGILADKGMQLRGRQLMLHQILGDPEDLALILLQYKTHGVDIDRIVLATPLCRLSERARLALLEAETMGVTLDFLEQRFGFCAGDEQGNAMGDLPGAGREAAMGARREAPGMRWYAPLKAAADVVVAAVLICISFPVISIVSLIVLWDVGWPIVFWQQRLGKNGAEFKLYKFRTMSVFVNIGGTIAPDEARTSRIGKVLRRIRLDELPQFYNILIGEMSFVGPRPLLASEQSDVDCARLSIRPGLTGWAQISGGRKVSTEEKVALDLWYMNRISPFLDAKIFVETVGVLLRGDRRDSKRILEAMKEASLDGGDALKSYLRDVVEAEREKAQLSSDELELKDGQRAA